MLRQNISLGIFLMCKIAIDFDGVIVERYGIPRMGDFTNCPQTEYAEEALKTLGKQHEIYILTSRGESEWEKIRTWLKINHLPKLRITNIKEKDTTIIIDDRAIRFTNWMDICKYFG